MHKARQTDTPVLAKQVDSKPLLSIVDQSYDIKVADGRAFRSWLVSQSLSLTSGTKIESL